MPVAGLPVTLDTVMGSLLTTNELPSWKMTGEPTAFVVVMRFRENDGQPLHECNIKTGAWKPKSKSQRLRDQRRSKKHRAKGELGAVPTFLTENAIENVDTTSIAPDAVVARDPCATTGSDQTTFTSVTFDPSCARVLPEMQPPPAITMQGPPEKETPPSTHVDLPDLPAETVRKQVSFEELRKEMEELVKTMRTGREELRTASEELRTAVEEGMDKLHSEMNINDVIEAARDRFHPATLSDEGAYRPFDIDRARLKFPAQIQGKATATTPCASDPPPSTRDMFVNTSRPVTRQTPPRTQLCTRTARFK